VARNAPKNDEPAELTGRAARKAAKRARKAGKTPWYKQIWQVYKMTRKAEPLIWLRLLLILFGVIVVFSLFGLLVWRNHLVYMATLGLPTGLIAALFVLLRRAERAAYAQIEGQEGASAAAIGQIRRGFTFESDPVAIDQRSHAMVFRGVGRPGVVLVAEAPQGSEARVEKLVEAERRKINRVAPDVPVVVLRTGNQAGQVPLRKLARTIQRLRPAISKAEIAVVIRRLKALSSMPIGIPKGIDPTRPPKIDRKALRGR
jgi:hypothetical protein